MRCGGYWVAVPDGDDTLIGRYDPCTFALAPVMKVPGLWFESRAMWVDEPEERILVAYEGHLLSIPLDFGATVTPRSGC